MCKLAVIVLPLSLLTLVGVMTMPILVMDKWPHLLRHFLGTN